MNSIFKEKHIALMILSLMVLLVFMGYFLKKEYDDEYQEIVDASQVEFSMKIFEDLERQPVKWVKDANTDSGFRLVVVSNSSDTTSFSDSTEFITTIISTEFSTDTTAPLKTFKLFESSPQNPVDTLDISNFRQDNRINGITVNQGEKTEFEFTTSESGAEESMLEVINRFEGGVKSSLVIKNMIPQILASLLLLLLTLLAYYLFLKRLKEEKALSTLRNDFMSNMSHELKTPVSTISVALEALSNFDAADNKEMRKEYIDISKNEIDRLNLLVDKALNLSLFEQGKFLYEKMDFNLDKEIQTIIKTLKVSLETNNTSMEYNSKGKNFWINADRTHIVNVIHNLIENAIKYSEENPEIDIKLIEKENQLQLVVTDNGPGIAPEYHNKIFDKFFRVPQGNTHNTKGHGLGLSYVKEVLDKHNATILLKSGTGAGTSFRINFPKISHHA